MNAVARLGRLRNRIVDEGLSAMIVSDPVNIAYITGFDGVFDSEDAHAAVVSASGAVLYTDSRYVEAARAAARGTDWQVKLVSANLYITLTEDAHAEGMSTLAIEESVPHGRFRFLSSRFDGNVEAVDQWVEDLRAVKDAEELERIAAAQQLTDAAFQHVLSLSVCGMTEHELALEIEYHMRKAGSEGVAFPAIVASGPNSALPHAHPTDRVIARGDLVVLDFGARVDGYCADMTRTVCIGAADERQREVYDAVRAANEAGTAAVKAGVPGQSVDAAARAVLESRGLGEAFGHGLGHGVGLEVHEAPGVGPRSSKSLPEGSVITIEPGAYLPGFGGVRIENLVVVESGGARVLTESATDLMEL